MTAHGEAVERPARLDSAGRYEVRDLEAGDWLLRASLWQGERQVEARVPIGPSDREIQRDLEFSPRVTLSGQVLFDGEPLGASTVAVRSERFSIERSVVSGSDGGFVLRDLEPDRYWLGVQNSQRFIAHNDTLDLYDSREVEIRLEAGAVAGRVEEKGSGEAVPGAILTLRPTQGPEFVISDSSQPDGSFHILHVPPGTYRLAVTAGGYAPAEREVSVAGGQQAAVDLGLTPTSGLDLQVRLASGQAPPMVHVLARNGEGTPVLAGTYMRYPSPYGEACAEKRVRAPAKPTLSLRPTFIEFRSTDRLESTVPHRHQAGRSEGYRLSQKGTTNPRSTVGLNHGTIAWHLRQEMTLRSSAAWPSCGAGSRPKRTFAGFFPVTTDQSSISS